MILMTKRITTTMKIMINTNHVKSNNEKAIIVFDMIDIEIEMDINKDNHNANKNDIEIYTNNHRISVMIASTNKNIMMNIIRE